MPSVNIPIEFLMHRSLARIKYIDIAVVPISGCNKIAVRNIDIVFYLRV